MTCFQQRNRIVLFRLTQEEYNSLQSACVAAGGRNLSDYTRTELLTAMQGDSRESPLARRFGHVEQQLSELHNMVKQVSERMTALELT